MVAKVLEIVSTETAPKLVRFQENGAPKNLTDYTITCRIGTSGSTTVKTGFIADAVNGLVEFTFNNLTPGSYPAEFVMINAYGSQPSELFTINVRSGV